MNNLCFKIIPLCRPGRTKCKVPLLQIPFIGWFAGQGCQPRWRQGGLRASRRRSERPGFIPRGLDCPADRGADRVGAVLCVPRAKSARERARDARRWVDFWLTWRLTAACRDFDRGRRSCRPVAHRPLFTTPWACSRVYSSLSKGSCQNGSSCGGSTKCCASR